MYEFICMYVHVHVCACILVLMRLDWETGLVNEIKVSVVSLFFPLIILCERISHVEE